MGYNIELKKIEHIWESHPDSKEWFGVFLDGERVKKVIVYKHTDDWIKNTYGLLRTDGEKLPGRYKKIRSKNIQKQKS